MISRNSFLSKASLAGVGSLSLSQVQPLSAEPYYKATAKNVIYLFMSGGMSHIDSFDPKPNKKDMQGQTKVIPTNVDGILVGEHLSRTAKLMDKCSLIRSMTSTQGSHLPGRYLHHTSYTQRGTIRHPSLGAWVSRMLGNENSNMPCSVVINDSDQGLASSSGYMESKYSAIPIGDPSKGLQNLNLPQNLNAERQEFRLSIAQKMNLKFRSNKNIKNMRSYGDAYESALRLMKSQDRNAFDIEKEPNYMRDLYGRNEFGNGCLLARRLIEHGVRFVEVFDQGWDHHTNIQDRFPLRCRTLDQGLSALITDLNNRGMLEDTLIVVATEFGRSPTIDINKGRGHFPKVFSHLLAGGGIKGGKVHGASDETGSDILHSKVSPQDFNATIGHALGINLDQIIMSPSLRPFQFAHHGKPVLSLFS